MIPDPRRARAACNLLFCAIPFLVVDVRVRGIDLVPDLVGLVMVAVATHRLGAQTRDPEAVRWLRAATLLAVVTIPVSLLADAGVPVHAMWRLTETALVAAWLVITCIGMEELARAESLPVSYAAWSFARRVTVVSIGTVLAAMLVAPFAPSFVFLVVALSLVLASLVLFLVACWRSHAEITA